MTRGVEAAPSGLPLVIGTVSLADRPEAHEAHGTGDKGGKKPPPHHQQGRPWYPYSGHVPGGSHRGGGRCPQTPPGCCE